jgi:hypothetical protein
MYEYTRIIDSKETKLISTKNTIVNITNEKYKDFTKVSLLDNVSEAAFIYYILKM